MLDRRRKMYASSGGATSESLLHTLVELEGWDEAEQELYRLYNMKRLSIQQKRYWQAMIAIGQGRYENAIQLAESLPREDWKDILEPLALAYVRQGLEETALRIAQEAIQEKCKNAERILADVYAESGDDASALLWYERAAQKRRLPDTICKMATILMRLGDYREARALYRQVISSIPYVNVENLDRLAECCRRLGDIRGAQEAEQLASRT